MELLQKLRIKWHQRGLKNDLKTQPRKHQSVNYQKASQIGILFDGSELQIREAVLKYADGLKKKGKKIKLLGFFNNKLDNNEFAFDTFSKKDFDWLYRPLKSKNVEEFIRKDFDLLLSLDMDDQLPLQFIAAKSAARFRVGPITNNLDCFELMIDLGGKKDIQQLTQQIDFYLNKMESTHGAATL